MPTHQRPRQRPKWPPGGAASNLCLGSSKFHGSGWAWRLKSRDLLAQPTRPRPRMLPSSARLRTAPHHTRVCCSPLLHFSPPPKVGPSILGRPSVHMSISLFSRWHVTMGRRTVLQPWQVQS